MISKIVCCLLLVSIVLVAADPVRRREGKTRYNRKEVRAPQKQRALGKGKAGKGYRYDKYKDDEDSYEDSYEEDEHDEDDHDEDEHDDEDEKKDDESNPDDPQDGDSDKESPQDTAADIFLPPDDVSEDSLLQACAVARDGKVFATANDVLVPYTYDLATNARDPYAVAQSVESEVQKFLTRELILSRCPDGVRRLQANEQDLENIRGIGRGITKQKQFSLCKNAPANLPCYVMDGLSAIYMEENVQVQDEDGLKAEIASLISTLEFDFSPSPGSVGFYNPTQEQDPTSDAVNAPEDTGVATKATNWISGAGIYAAAIVAVGVAAASSIVMIKKRRRSRADRGVYLDDDDENPLASKGNPVYRIDTTDDWGSADGTASMGPEEILADLQQKADLQRIAEFQVNSPFKVTKVDEPDVPYMSPRAYSTPNTVHL